jgi:hypothetical protein
MKNGQKLKLQIKEGLLPDDKVKNFDMDRLYELDEDFLTTNNLKPWAMKSHEIKKNKETGEYVKRTLVGPTETYRQGLQMDYIKQ